MRINQSNAGGVTKISIGGRITEEADFRDAQPQAAGRVVFDLGEVKAINSCGVREWVKFVQHIPGQVEFFYHRTPATMAAQANMIAGFLGRGRVLTVLAPYYCDQCSEGHDVLLDVQKDLAQTRAPPARACPTCKSPLTFDDVPGFFDFLKPAGH